MFVHLRSIDDKTACSMYLARARAQTTQPREPCLAQRRTEMAQIVCSLSIRSRVRIGHVKRVHLALFVAVMQQQQPR